MKFSPVLIRADHVLDEKDECHVGPSSDRDLSFDPRGHIAWPIAMNP
jgi:hypothetical protein